MSNSAPPPRRLPAWLARTLGLVPAAAVAAGLVGVAYWGRATEWTFGTRDDPAPEVVATPLFKVELAPPDGPHATPTTVEQARVDRALAVRPRSVPEVPPPLGRWQVRFDSPEAVARAGVATQPATTAEVADTIRASGDLDFEPNRLARLAPRVAGPAVAILKGVGDPVTRGEVLAWIDSAEVGRRKAELLKAVVAARQKRGQADALEASAVRPELRRQEAEAAAQEAAGHVLALEQSLANLGLIVRAADWAGKPVAAIAADLARLGQPPPLPGREASSTLWPLRSTLTGVVLRAELSLGEVADPMRTAFAVADPRSLHLALHVPVSEARWVRVGQQVRFRPDGGDEVTAPVHAVGSSVDEATRTVEAICDLPNEQNLLRANAFGTGELVLRTEPNAVVVPPSAVLEWAGYPVVLVEAAPGLFRPRPVRVGVRTATQVEVITGLAAGEVVVTAGGSQMLSALQRGGGPGD